MIVTWALAVQYHDHDKILQPSKTHARHDYLIIAEPFFKRTSAMAHKMLQICNNYVLIYPATFICRSNRISGAPLMNFRWYLTLGNINNGGTVFPAVFMVHARVTK